MCCIRNGRRGKCRLPPRLPLLFFFSFFSFFFFNFFTLKCFLIAQSGITVLGLIFFPHWGGGVFCRMVQFEAR